MYSAGFVIQPNRHFSGNVDWWEVDRIGTIQSFGTTVLLANYDLFKDRFARNAAGDISKIDTRWVNAGRTSTKGIDFGLKGDTEAGRGKLSAGFDLSTCWASNPSCCRRPRGVRTKWACSRARPRSASSGSTRPSSRTDSATGPRR
jgi:hypothetical protein